MGGYVTYSAAIGVIRCECRRILNRDLPARAMGRIAHEVVGLRLSKNALLSRVSEIVAANRRTQTSKQTVIF